MLLRLLGLLVLHLIILLRSLLLLILLCFPSLLLLPLLILDIALALAPSLALNLGLTCATTIQFLTAYCVSVFLPLDFPLHTILYTAYCTVLVHVGTAVQSFYK
jgi:hypothetical protein